MRDVIKPVYTAAVGRAEIRFFRAPFDEPHPVWHAVDDLHRALALPRDARREFKSRLEKDWRGDVRHAFTGKGFEFIAPHWMAEGLIGATKEAGRLPISDFEVQFAFAETMAMSALTAHLSPLEAINYAIAAFRNAAGKTGPHPQLTEASIIYPPKGSA